MKAKYIRETEYCDKCGKVTMGLFHAEDGKKYCFDDYFAITGVDTIHDLLAFHIISEDEHNN